jgi:hypothetical protein
MSNIAYFRVLKLPDGHWGFVDAYVNDVVAGELKLERIVLADSDPVTIEAFDIWRSEKTAGRLAIMESSRTFVSGETVTFPFFPSLAPMEPS